MTIATTTKKADDLLIAHLSRSESGNLKNWDVSQSQIETFAAALGKPKKVTAALNALRSIISDGANRNGMRGYAKDTDLIELIKADLPKDEILEMAVIDSKAHNAKTGRTDYWASELLQSVRVMSFAATAAETRAALPAMITIRKDGEYASVPATKREAAIAQGFEVVL